MEKALSKLAGIRSRGKISEMYLSGYIPDDIMVKYCQAIEAFKKECHRDLDDWYTLPKSLKMTSSDRRLCKLYWLERQC